MSKERTPLSNGLLYGLTTGLFGGSVWALLVSMVPDESLVTSRWIVIGGGLLLWIFVGFVVGVFNTPRLASVTASLDRTEDSLLRRMLLAVGWLLYRLLVGYFVGVIATSLFSLVGLSLWFAAARFSLRLDKAVSDTSVASALVSGLMASIACGFSGAVFGSLIGTRWSPFHRPTVGSRAVRSSFLSFLFGLPFGTALGWLPTEQSQFFSCAASVPIGILAGVLGGLWTEVHNIRRARND